MELTLAPPSFLSSKEEVAGEEAEDLEDQP